MSSMHKTVARQRRDCDLIPGLLRLSPAPPKLTVYEPNVVVLVYVASSLVDEDEYNVSFRQSRSYISYCNCDSFDSH